jgi:hypothetical protein
MNLTTPCHKIWPLRATGAEDASRIDLATAGDYAQRPTTGVTDILKDALEWTDNSSEHPSLTHDTQTNGMEIYIAGSTAHSQNVIWYLTAWRNENGPAKRVAQGTATTGTQAVVKWPHNNAAVANTFWCDTIVITWENWLKEVEATDTGNSNSVASLWLDTCGYRYWMIEFNTTDATATALTNLTAFYGRF